MRSCFVYHTHNILIFVENRVSLSAFMKEGTNEMYRKSSKGMMSREASISSINDLSVENDSVLSSDLA